MNSLKQSHNRIIIVAYRLPFTIKRTNEGTELFQNSGGLVSAVLSLAEQVSQSTSDNAPKIHWVGQASNDLADLPRSVFENENFVAHPVFIDDEVNKRFYEGFANDLIWPLFHYFPTYASFREEDFEAYQQANTRFLEEITAIIQPGDLVWIQDFQLMLLPDMLRQAVPDACIGYFFHIPFPNYEIIKLLPRTWRQALISGVLGADVVGFHTNDYVQHFLNSVTEVLGLPNINQRIVLPERSVVVKDFPISIDYNKFNQESQTPEVIEIKQRYQKLVAPHKLIFSVDRLDYTKGITYRLQGYERFLDQNPDWHDRVTFVMNVVPSRDQIGQYQELKREIDETVGRINGLYGGIGWRPIVYSYKSLEFNKLLASYTSCDVALITPIRDGMNLVCKEFVASRFDNQGVLILSELTGAAQELPEALIINPTDTQEVASAILQALNMDPDEQARRMQIMRKHIQNHNVFRWSHDFMNTFEQATDKHPVLETDLSVDAYLTAFDNASRRLLLFDFDGTLAPLVNDPSDARLSDTMRQTLSQLAQQSDIVVISGRNRKFLEATFDGLPVQLVAEHGAFLKKSDQEWERLDLSDGNWVDLIHPLLKQYVDQFPGTFVEAKETAIAWHYRRSAAEDIESRAVELATQLRNVQSSVPLTVIQGNKVIEIKPAQHSKGTVARTLYEQESYNFIVSIGDDTTDEDMFRQMPNWAYTIKVGTGSSFAQYRLARQHDVETLLQLMSNSLVNS
jgi:trehalose 6-phosphate synthase/phosphatase